MSIFSFTKPLILQDKVTGTVYEPNSAEQAATMLRHNHNLTEYPGSGTFQTLDEYYGIAPNGDRIDGGGVIQNLLGNPGNVPGSSSDSDRGVFGFVNNLLFGSGDSGDGGW